MLYVFIATCILRLSEGLRMATQNDENITKKANIYVLNLKERKDRCLFTSAQLASSPFPVFRMEAATPVTQFDKCPTLEGLRRGVVAEDYGEKFHSGGQTALYCSNYITWEHAQAQNTEFTVILEDDVILKEDFWQKMQSFLSSDCTGEQWDRVLVDTFRFGVDGCICPCAGDACLEPPHAQKNICTAPKNTYSEDHVITTARGYGTHVQIFRTSSLMKYLHQKNAQILDHTIDPEGAVVRYWNPDVVKQADMYASEQLPMSCSDSVKESNIVALAGVPAVSDTEFAFEC
eukprot:gnl/MRDRNA2_/MRDRNA2_60836_c0_seq1.p1 gnl/MRDRNA2_/MRDRNA2_60836_c0~~gnl/MRDRNA2_/MRDRNA2_60836_c0_seq1.p1  ORF type:complete len:290 (+),score=35.89 gnl/MRDRNA2_/MRDRNA2_60836_c0_seq1:107-976(+)